MFSFLKIAGVLRAAKAALSAKSYLEAGRLAADLLELLGQPGPAATVRKALDAIGDGDARAIAVAALQTVADVLALYFGWESPIVVSVSATFETDSREECLAHKLGDLAEGCDAETEPPTTAAAGTPDTVPAEVATALIAAQCDCTRAILEARA